MKILILTALYPPLGFSGHDDRCRQVVEALTKRGHRVQVLTSDYRMPPMGVTGEKGVFRQLHLHEVEADPDPAGQSYRAAFEEELENAQVLYNRVDRFEPEVIYVWNMQGLSKSLLFSLENHGHTLVYDLHTDWLSPQFFESCAWFRWWKHNSSRRSKLYRGYLRIMGAARRHLRHLPIGGSSDLDLSNAYVSSRSLRDEFVAAGIAQAGDLPVVAPALDTKCLFAKEHYDAGQKFLWAGTVCAGKAPEVALEAVALLRERGVHVSLDFYGMGAPSELKALRARINASELSDQVRMVGIRPGELTAKYQEYDALLFTSRCNDPFPITPLEAMLSGLPCILSKDGGIVEVVEDGTTALLFEAGEASALADAMQRFMALPDGGEGMSKKCMESLQVQHSLNTVIGHIESILARSLQS